MASAIKRVRSILAVLLSLTLVMTGMPAAAWAEAIDESGDTNQSELTGPVTSTEYVQTDVTDDDGQDEQQVEEAVAEDVPVSDETDDQSLGQTDISSNDSPDDTGDTLPEQGDETEQDSQAEQDDQVVVADTIDASVDDVDSREETADASEVVSEASQDAAATVDGLDAQAELDEEPLKAATTNDLLNKKILLKQSRSGRCTLASTVMLLRRAAMLNGHKDWAKITEQSIEGVAWLGDNTGLLYNFTFMDMTVAHATLSNSNESVLRKLLVEHPEGVVIYAPGHTVLLTDYTNGQLWCADPGYGDRRPLSEAYVTRATNVTQYWYISSEVEKPLKSNPLITWKRLAGAGRYDTMASIVKAGWSKTTGGTVLVATGEGFKDALAAAGLAGLEEAPVVLTAGASLSSAAKTRLTALKPKKVYVVGGPVAVSDKVMSQIKTATGVAPKRISGSTSPATSAALATAGKGRWSDATAIIATNKTFKDALSVAPVAYAKGWPILLASDGASLSKAVLKALKECGIKQVIIVGGEMAVTPHVVDQLKAQGITVKTRLAGKTGTGTSLAIAKWAVKNGLSPKGMAFATSQNFPDALAGAAFCGKNKAVLLLADDQATDNLSFALTYLDKIKTGYVFGGATVFSDKLFRNLPQ